MKSKKSPSRGNRNSYAIGFAPTALCLLALVGVFLLTERGRAWFASAAETAGRPFVEPPVRQNSTARGHTRGRNLSLRPEAFGLSQRLGGRFRARGHEVAVMSGTLTVGSGSQNVRIRRSQEDGSERLEVALGGAAPSLVWSEDGGALSSGSGATGDERTLLERLAFDSPDRFVLAQLSGASYYTVARNARPAEAGGADDYTGPVYTVVRLDERRRGGEEPGRPRLYYLNSRTGLLDRVVSDEDGVRITAEFSGWADFAGEYVPTHVVWRRQGQVVMELRLSNVAHGPGR